MHFIGKIQDDVSLDKEEKIIIYGCGKTGKQALKELKKRNLSFKVQAFCDKNTIGNCSDIEGEQYPLLSVQKACETYPDAAYLVASCCVKEMVLNLKKYEINNIHVIWIGD